MLREQAGLTQKELAEMLGMSQSNYSKYEYGTREPNLENIYKLSDILNCSIDYLFGKEPQRIETEAVPMLKDVIDEKLIFDESSSLSLPKEYTEGEPTFIYRMPDNSMTLLGLHKGNFAVAKMTNDINESDIVVVKLDDEILVRTISYLDDKIVLSPSTTKMAPLLVDKDKVKIVGRLIGIFRDFSNDEI
ncbi:hypothetical protein CJP46_35330 [Paenibacillus sp. XY044]|nr:hypothetical protein CJP46_35330 [Paenibacillus sp. XY044]